MKTAAGRRSAELGFWEFIGEAFLGVRRTMDCIQVEVTSRCPGRCGYCPHTARRERWQDRDMGMETFDRLWPLMRVANRVHLQGWGEPLAHPHFFDLAALARKAGCAVSTTLCGLYMNERAARQLAESGIDIVAFSLVGTDAASNAARNGVDFDRVCQAIGLLQGARRAAGAGHPDVHLAYLMLASDMQAVRHLPALAHRLGVQAVVVSTLGTTVEPGFEAEAFTPHDSEKLARAAAVLADAGAEASRLDVAFHWSLPGPDSATNGCRENVARSLYVAADGSVSPCVHLNIPDGRVGVDRPVFGNVNEIDPRDIWTSPAFRRFREGLAGGEPAPPCRTCPQRFMT